jgi:hypothetical protein
MEKENKAVYTPIIASVRRKIKGKCDWKRASQNQSFQYGIAGSAAMPELSGRGNLQQQKLYRLTEFHYSPPSRLVMIFHRQS